MTRTRHHTTHHDPSWYGRLLGREYWSKRASPGYTPWGPLGKWITKRKERAEERRMEEAAKKGEDL